MMLCELDGMQDHGKSRLLITSSLKHCFIKFSSPRRRQAFEKFISVYIVANEAAYVVPALQCHESQQLLQSSNPAKQNQLRRARIYSTNLGPKAFLIGCYNLAQTWPSEIAVNHTCIQYLL